jgi:hypothetical protein
MERFLLEKSLGISPDEIPGPMIISLDATFVDAGQSRRQAFSGDCSPATAVAIAMIARGVVLIDDNSRAMMRR